MAMQKRACFYQYDALDRLASRSSGEQGATRLFYCASRLSTESEGSSHRAYIHSPDQLLAQQAGVARMLSTALIAPDRANSVLAMVTPGQQTSIVYNPYGHRSARGLLPGLPGFNGEHPDPLTGHYLLGNGYRAYNPMLMRFNSPDSLSPFGEGGLNAYAYCRNDPVNHRDPSGHASNRNQILGFIWIGVGFLGAAWGLKLAVPAIQAIAKGGTAISQKLTAAGAVGQMAGSSLFTGSRVTGAIEPETSVAEALLWGALAIGIPALGARVSSFYRARWEARQKMVTRF